MTDLEFLKQESGMTDDELKQFETAVGSDKFRIMLSKTIAARDVAIKEREEAERQRIETEDRYTNVMMPELRKVTQEALTASGEAARMRAELEKAREYGIVPPEEKKEPITPRAPGSPDPQYLSKDDFSKLQFEAGSGLAAMNDLNAEHFKLFGSPVPNMQELIATVTRERKLGQQADIRSVWEKSHNVAAKREEIKAAEQKKHDDEVSANAIKSYAEKHGDNGNVRSGRPSRYSTYDPSKMTDGSKPWQRPSGMKRANNEGWRKESVAKLEQAAGGR